MARISLICEVAAFDTLAPKSGASSGSGTRSAAKFIPPILFMQLVVWLPILVINLALSRVGQSMSEAFYNNAQTGASTVPDFSASFGTVCVLGTGLTVLMLLFSFIDAFAYRSIILEGFGVIQGIQRAVQVIRANLKPILVLSVICLVIGLILSFVIGLILMPLALPILRPLLADLSQCAPGQDYRAMLSCIQQQSTSPVFIIAGLLLSVVGAALSALWVAFQSVTFTLAYRRLAQIDSPRDRKATVRGQRA